jgi:CheY-like chemotaxis protein
MENRRLLAVGEFDSIQKAVLVPAAAEAAFDTAFVTTAREAVEWHEARRAHAVLIEAENLSDKGASLRGATPFADVPMLVGGRDVGDLGFASTYAYGGDDLVPLDRARPLTARLRSLPRDAQTVANGRGGALVADPDRTHRAVLGRVLRNAGYSVTFAVTGDDAQNFAAKPDLKLAVISAGLDMPPRTLIENARSGGATNLWIVTCPPRDLKNHRERLAGLDQVAVSDGFAPAENVLFLSNEMGARDLANKRASARLLYGTSVGFRGAGRDVDEIGFTYNISAQGLYVRTLAPPDEEIIWLELCPPRSERRVRLVGKVAWRRRYGLNERATVPPGFGMQIIDGAAADRAAWQAGYDAFAFALG